MILKAFSEYLQSFDSRVPPVIILSKWLRNKLKNPPQSHVDKVIHEEVAFAKNALGAFILIGRSPTGQKLIESLYNYALAYENQSFAKWLHETKASDFKEENL